MIEIAPILTTPPIPKIKKIIRDGQKSSEQQAQQNKDKNKEEESNGSEPTHIDEIV